MCLVDSYHDIILDPVVSQNVTFDIFDIVDNVDNIDNVDNVDTFDSVAIQVRPVTNGLSNVGLRDASASKNI